MRNVSCLAVTISLISKGRKAQSVPALLIVASSIVCTVPPLSAVGQQLPLFGATEKQTLGLSKSSINSERIYILQGAGSSSPSKFE